MTHKLLADVSSLSERLEILSNQNEWLRASVDEGVIICNIGDMLQRLTNNTLRSTTHRVKAIGDEMNSPRYSIPFFLHPSPDTILKSIYRKDDEGVLAHDFLDERLKHSHLNLNI